MRIISGTAGGIPIHVPKKITRPTTDRVRESLFSSLGNIVAGARVLDLFAGSGALGLECLSRGATSVEFVDESREACQSIRRNLEKAKLDGGRVHQRKVFAFLEGISPTRPFDLIFADPPYAKDDALQSLLENLLTHPSLPPSLSDDGLFVLESSGRHQLPESELWAVSREKSYGDTLISFLAPNRST